MRVNVWMWADRNRSRRHLVNGCNVRQQGRSPGQVHGHLMMGRGSGQRFGLLVVTRVAGTCMCFARPGLPGAWAASPTGKLNTHEYICHPTLTALRVLASSSPSSPSPSSVLASISVTPLSDSCRLCISEATGLPARRSSRMSVSRSVQSMPACVRGKEVQGAQTRGHNCTCQQELG